LPSNVLIQLVVPETCFNHPLSSNGLLQQSSFEENGKSGRGVYSRIMEHPAHSPDFTPSGFHFFLPRKKLEEGEDFDVMRM
jgi:hypothetical protein